MTSIGKCAVCDRNTLLHAQGSGFSLKCTSCDAEWCLAGYDEAKRTKALDEDYAKAFPDEV